MQNNEWSLSSSQEDYIEAISELITEHGHAHTKDIATRLGVKMPSVTSALRILADMKLIEYQSNRPVELTFEGKVLAGKIIRKHRAFKRFFRNILGLSEEKSDEIACKMEHLIDYETEIRFLAFMDIMENWDAGRERVTMLGDALLRILDTSNAQ